MGFSEGDRVRIKTREENPQGGDYYFFHNFGNKTGIITEVIESTMDHKLSYFVQFDSPVEVEHTSRILGIIEGRTVQTVLIANNRSLVKYPKIPEELFEI